MSAHPTERQQRIEKAMIYVGILIDQGKVMSARRVISAALTERPDDDQPWRG